MSTQFTPEYLKATFNGQNKTIIYDEAVRMYYKLKVHADGEVPIWLIKKQRPNESDAVMKYRESIYEAETQNPVERVIGTFEKIRRSPDFMIRFSDDVPDIIAEDETPENYLTVNYPVYGSIEDWAFEEGLRTIALDANAVIAVMPVEFNLVENVYVKPIARVFNSTSVIQFVAEDYAILKGEEYSSLLTPELQQQRYQSTAAAMRAFMKGDEGEMPPFTIGQVYYVINTIFYQKWEMTEEGKYQLTEIFPHGLDELPVFQVPGKFVKRYGQSVLKKTLLNPMIPHLNKAARESNDLDAGVIMHMFLEKWRIENNKCPKCNGTGKIASTSGPVPCSRCDGTGYATGKSPFDEMRIKPAAIGEQNIPTPPVGYVQKDTTIIKIQNDRIEQHIYKSLASINMQHLADVLLNQSGTAKEWDNDGTNTVVYSFAGMLVGVINLAVYFINELRYRNLIPNDDERKALMPIIPVPEKFDILNTSFLLTEFDVGKKAGLSSAILNELQRELAQKKFYSNPEVADIVNLILSLDPFPGRTIDEKAMMETSGLATKEDIVLSNYIDDFIRQAIEDDQKFPDKTNSEKRKILLVMAKKKVTEMSAATQVINSITGINPVGGNGMPQNLGANGQPNPPSNIPVNGQIAAI